MTYSYVFSGLMGGFLIGMTGVGGGSLMTPLLILGFGIAPATAVGTDLLYAAVTKSGGVWSHAQRHQVDWPVTRRMLMGSIPASILTLWLSSYWSLPFLNSHGIRGALGFALLLTALALVCGLKQRHCALPSSATQGSAHYLPWWGALVGVLVSLSSVGAGAIGTSALVILYPTMSLARIIGTDIAHAVPLTLVAGIAHWQQGHVDSALLISLLVGSLPGVWLGARLHGLIPERLLRWALVGVLALLGLRLMM